MQSTTQEIDPELHQILNACKKYLKIFSGNNDNLLICYSGIIDFYIEMYGTGFHQSKLKQLCKLGFLVEDISNP